MATKNLPARVEEYTALQAQSTFTKSEQTAFNELSTYINQHTKENLWWYWDLGSKVAKIHKDAQKDQRLYGVRLLPRLAAGLGYKTDRQLRNAMAVVDLFQTKKAFQQYLKLQGESGNMLQWSHMVYLAKISDDKMRMQLAANTLEQCWTSEELWARVKALSTGKARGAGRPPKTKIPSTARGCLTHIGTQAQKFVDNHDKAWTGDAFDIAEKVKEIPADKLTDDLLSQVTGTREQLLAMASRANDYADVLLATSSNIERRLTAQASHDAEVAAAAEGAEGDAEPVVAPATTTAPKKKAVKKKAAKKKAAKKRAGRVGVTR